MNWLNLETNLTRHPEFLASDLAQRGAWVSLIVWCADVENGGRLANAAAWPAQMWAATCGIDAKIVLKPCQLWHWEDADLVVWGYPKGKESQVKEGRKQGEYGKEGGRPKKPLPKTPSENPSCLPLSETPKGKERKGIGMEVEGNESESPPPVEFPDGFPDSADKAVAWVSGVRPDIDPVYIRHVWQSLIGVGCKDGSGRLVTNWAGYIAGRWPKDGARVVHELSQSASPSGNSSQKNKEGAARKVWAGEPEWDWMQFAKDQDPESVVDSVWENNTARWRSGLRGAYAEWLEANPGFAEKYVVQKERDAAA